MLTVGHAIAVGEFAPLDILAEGDQLYDTLNGIFPHKDLKVSQ